MNPEKIPLHLESLESNIEFKQSNRSAEFIRGEEETGERYIRQGQLLHNLFSVIRTQDATRIPASRSFFASRQCKELGVPDNSKSNNKRKAGH